MRIWTKEKYFDTDIKFHLQPVEPIPSHISKTEDMPSYTNSDKESHHASGDSHRHTARGIGARVAAACASGTRRRAQLRHNARQD
jgi:hypothetical protein